MMRQAFREFRRAPARISASIVALALALGAMGVFAIPSVAASSLRESVDRDRMANLSIDTTPTESVDLAAVAMSVENVDAAVAQVLVDIEIGPGSTLSLIGRDFDTDFDSGVDIVSVTAGRLPATDGEVLVSAGHAEVGQVIVAGTPDGRNVELSVVGVGGTTYWAGETVAFSTVATATDVVGAPGFDRLAIRANASSSDALRATADDVRERLAAHGISLTTLPNVVPNGTHPIEEDISQVSTMIGLLGIVAGLVALVLLGSTTNTLITERTRETAVMRALGARNRPLRRRLRRLAVAIAATAAVAGLPLGILVSNVIARMVMEEFLGLTPGLAVSVPVLLASAVFALAGAALVASGAARRVTRIPLATALRDRDGSPFGRRLAERLVARLRLGGLLDRAAVRNAVHRRSRSVAVVAQVTAAVAALLVIASLATTVNAFNASEYEPWEWESRTTVSGSGLDIDAAAIASTAPHRVEPAIETDAELDGWEIELFGLAPDTEMIETSVDVGSWVTDPGDAVITTGFAERIGVDVGDEIDVVLATGSATYRVSGLHPLRNRAVFVDLDALALDLGQPGRANVALSSDANAPRGLDGLTTTIDMDNYSSDENGRSAILLIFGSIGLVVVAVAGLAVASGLAVNVYERRHEFAAIRAIGGRSRQVMRVVSAELLPLAALGIALGVGVGFVGARAIVGQFEQADAVEIGFTFADGAIPVVAVTVVLGCLLIASLTVRRISRESAATTLRSAS